MVALNVQCSMFNGESSLQLSALLVAAVVVARVTTLSGFVVVGDRCVGCHHLNLLCLLAFVSPLAYRPSSVATRHSSSGKPFGSALAAPSVHRLIQDVRCDGLLLGHYRPILFRCHRPVLGYRPPLSRLGKAHASMALLSLLHRFSLTGVSSCDRRYSSIVICSFAIIRVIRVIRVQRKREAPFRMSLNVQCSMVNHPSSSP